MGGKKDQEDPLMNVFWDNLAHRNLTLDGRLQSLVKSEMLAPYMYFRTHALVPLGGWRGEERENMNECECVCRIHLGGGGKEGERGARLNLRKQDTVTGAPSAFSSPGICSCTPAFPFPDPLENEHMGQSSLDF